MAHGQRTIGAVQGATAGAAAGPFGAIIGGVAGYGLASMGSLFGGKRKKPPLPQPWYVKHAAALTIGGAVAFVGVLVGAVVLANRR